MGHGLTRRTFIQQAACASAVLASVGRASAQSAMFLSLNGSLTRQMAWADFVRLAGKVGYPGVDVQLAAARKDGVEATKALLKEARVKPGVTNLPVQFAAADEAAYQTGLAQLEENAKFAAEIGCTRMMAVLSPASNEPRDERRKFVLTRLTPIAAILQKSGIRLGLEFLGPLMFRTRAKEPFIWTLPETVALAKEIGPNIGATLDAWHWHHSGGTVADIVATDRSRIVHIHVSDAKPQPPEEVRDNQRHMPGEGVIDLVGFFQALKAIGYQGGVAPETIGPRIPDGMPPEESAKLALDATTAILKKAGVA